MNVRYAIVRPPSVRFADGLTAAGLGPPDLPRARAQHEAYARALEALGVTVTRLPEDPRFPDGTFVEDTAVVTSAGAILCRPGAPSRAGEVEAIREAIAAAVPIVGAIEPPGTVDGGDVCEADGRFVIGISERTNEAGASQLATMLRGLGHAAVPVDIRDRSGLLHLKSGVAWLGGGRIAAVSELSALPAFASWETVPVAATEAYAANCVLCNGSVLVAAGFPRFDAALKAAGYRTLRLDMSEFRKMDGGLSCLSLRVGA